MCIKDNDLYFIKTEEDNPYPRFKYVDLGLTSGTLWADCNIVASSPEECGDYFMWGSIEPDTNNNCVWQNTPFNNGSSSFNLSYFTSVKDTVCPNYTLANEYDAARHLMGGNWKMPTINQFSELISQTNNGWVTNYNNTGVNGYKFTSKKDSSKYIFIPESTWKQGTTFIGKGNISGLWSLNIPQTQADWQKGQAQILVFINGQIRTMGVDRSFGLCIRAVK